MGFIPKLGEIAVKTLSTAKRVAIDSTLPQRINLTRMKIAEVDAKLDKAGWSPGTKDERQSLMMKRQVLTQELGNLVEQQSKIDQQKKDWIRNMR